MSAPAVRPFRAGDEAGVRALFETCHRRPLPEDVFRWRYAARPHGAPVTQVAEADGEIVGHVSALPVRLERGAQAENAGFLVDLMVHPSHRNLTLFLDMAEAHRARCAQAGRALIFAFPNGNSAPVFKRMLGWQDAGDVLALEAPLAAVRRPQDAGAAVRVETFGPEFDEAWPRLRPRDRWCAARGAEALTWRYRGRPGGRYPVWAVRGADGRVEGWLAAKTFDGPQGRVGDILELHAGPRAAAALLGAALDFFKSENVLTVSAWALEGTPQRSALEALGLKPGADRTHFAGRRTAEDGKEFPARHADWSLFKGDSDVF